MTGGPRGGQRITTTTEDKRTTACCTTSHISLLSSVRGEKESVNDETKRKKFPYKEERDKTRKKTIREMKTGRRRIRPTGGDGLVTTLNMLEKQQKGR